MSFRASKKNIKKNITEALELPKEILLNLPLVTIIGNEDFKIENYKNILEYSENKLKINTSCGILKIEGTSLTLKEISSEKLLISGIIKSFEYLS